MDDSKAYQHDVSITYLPPEILEKIFACLSSDIQCMRSISGVCPTFHDVVCKVCHTFCFISVQKYF